MSAYVDGLLARLRADLARVRCDPHVCLGDHGRWLFWALALAAAGGLLLQGHGGYGAGFRVLNQLAPLLPAAWWQALTSLGDTAVLLALFLPFARRYPHVLWALVLTALLATLYSRGLKVLVDAPRPPGVLLPGEFYVVGPAYERSSFPSGHTTAVFAAVAVWLYYLRSTSLRAVLVLGAVAVGMSRVVVGVHWPMDVVMGAIVGLGAGWQGAVWARRWPAGLRLRGHLAVLLVPLVATLSLLVTVPEYPLVRTLYPLLGTLCLGLFAATYLRAIPAVPQAVGSG